jgi:ribonucleoside-diphosphate reductase alpha chain
LKKDPEGRVIETPRQMLWRVANAVAVVEANHGATAPAVDAVAHQFFRMMGRRRFLPNSPSLMNAGREKGMCCGCFVLPVEDSIEGIFDTIKQTALVQRAGGGTGFALDQLRPTGDYVASSGGRTSGPISFWRVLAETTNAIQQGAHRRGANMGLASIEHPDILKFIDAKNQPGAFENFNVSIKVPDNFMEKLASDPGGRHIVVNPRNGQRYVIPKAVNIASYTIQDLIPPEGAHVPCYTHRDIWQKIIANAHATGEPGVVFIDRMNRDNPTPALGRIEATNPCGEQPLLPYESCNLGSINLGRIVRPDGQDMDWALLTETVKTAVRFLDNVVDMTYYPTETIRARSLANRKIGLGVMGFADCLILLGLRYDTQEAVQFASKVSRFIQEQAHLASQQLAEERGVFPNWEASTWHAQQNRPMRNASVTTVAPTGSISILGNCSSGIEPIYSLAYLRRALNGKEFTQVHPLLEKLGLRQGWMTQAIADEMLKRTPAKDIPGLPPALAAVLVTAHEVAPEQHVKMQAAVQSETDSAVSKTINLPATATFQDVDDAFQLAFKLGCKGVTVYRDGSRSHQTLSTANPGPASPTTGRTPRPRGRVMIGQTVKSRTGCGTVFVTVNRDEHGLAEVFSNLNKAGCISQSEATCRAISIALRAGVSPQAVIEQLKGIRCVSTCVARKTNSDVDVLSCPDAIAKAIEEAMGESKGVTEPATGRRCPDCGYPLLRESGCWVCKSCGSSKCD